MSRLEEIFGYLPEFLGEFTELNKIITAEEPEFDLLWGNLEDIKKQLFCENAREVPDLRDPDCLHVYLRHTAEYAGEEWTICLLFQSGYFHALWLKHAKLFQQRSLLKNAASNPGIRKDRAALYSN